VLPEKRKPGVVVRLEGVETMVPDAGRDFPAPPDLTLLALLEAQLRIDFEEKAMILGMPQRIGSGRPR
jgi:hypothetical protein